MRGLGTMARTHTSARISMSRVNEFATMVRMHRDPRYALDHLVPSRLYTDVVYSLSASGFKIPAKYADKDDKNSRN